jgi:hypothetical protein
VGGSGHSGRQQACGPSCPEVSVQACSRIPLLLRHVARQPRIGAGACSPRLPPPHRAPPTLSHGAQGPRSLTRSPPCRSSDTVPPSLPGAPVDVECPGAQMVPRRSGTAHRRSTRSSPAAHSLFGRLTTDRRDNAAYWTRLWAGTMARLCGSREIGRSYNHSYCLMQTGLTPCMVVTLHPNLAKSLCRISTLAWFHVHLVR